MKIHKIQQYLILFTILFSGTLLIFFTTTKKYQNSIFPTSFRYPSSWFLCEEFYPNLSDYAVHLSDKPIDCSNISFDVRAKFKVSISINTSEKIKATDIGVWIANYNNEIEIKQKENQEKGLMPLTNIQKWDFVRYVDNFIKDQEKNSVAEVKNFYDSTEYLYLKNGYLYQLQIDPTTKIASLPIKLILISLLFK